MDFTISSIQPKGRQKYGTYIPSKNLTTKVQQSIYNGNASTGGGTGVTSEAPVQEETCVMFLMKDTNVFMSSALAVGPQTDSVRVVGYRGTEMKQVYIGNLSGRITSDTGSTTPSSDYDITGLTSGVTVSVDNNGTTACTINFTVDSSVTVTGGTLVIPANLCISNNDLGNSYVDWKASNDENNEYTGDATGQLFTANLEYHFKVDMDTRNLYLDLSNDSAGVNCDINGNVIPASAALLHCKATMYYGTQALSGVTYGKSTPQAAAATGVSINSSTGELSFGNDFNFQGSILEITVFGNVSGSSIQKIMSVTKNYPGADGQATTRWLVPSRSEITFNPNTSAITPSTITVTAMTQVNDNEPVVDNDTVIWWDWDKTSLLSHSGRTGLSISVTTGHTYLTIALKNSGGTYYEMETIPVLTDGKNGKDGQDGSPGAQGRTGAAILGPTEWTGALQRRWHSGNENAVGTATADDLKFLDIIFRVVNGSKVYYYCNTSYTSSGADSWSSVSSYWTQTNDQYEFVATKVLLAQNAYIDFMTGNEIYLRDTGGTVTAGAAGGTGVTFWAGSDTPGNAPFQVDYQGNMTAKSGTFAGYIQMPYTFVSDLSTSSGYRIADSHAYLVCDSTADLKLPAPSSSLNGFMYDIIVEPTQTKSSPKELKIVAADGSLMYCYAYSEVYSATTYTMTGGHYQIVCMPKDSDGTIYRWAITTATGGLKMPQGNNMYFMSSVVGLSLEGNDYALNKIVVHPGNSKPTVDNPDSTMFVSRS